MADPRDAREPVTAAALWPRLLRLSGLVAVTLVLANCGQGPRVGGRLDSQESREIGAFPQSRYGAASPRVVGEGQDVPKGGGRDHVGRPYSVAGKRYVPCEKPSGYSATGLASWYGPAFHGRRTANGEVYDRHGVSAAHPTLPLPSYVRVTNLRNKRSIIVRVNDRGPFHRGRIIDLSQKTAEALEFRHIGTAEVKIDYLGRASLRGSDDRKLLATLTTDGRPAILPGATQPGTLLASAEPAPVGSSAAIGFAPVAASAANTTVVTRNAPEDTTPALRPTQVALVDTASASSAAASSALPPGARLVSGIPMPPDRPFDLGTIPNAAIPVAVAVPGIPLPPSRSQLAGLFYAQPQAASRFERTNAFSGLRPQAFAPLGASVAR